MPDNKAGFGNAYGWSRLVFDLAALTFVRIIRTAINRNDVKIGNGFVFQWEDFGTGTAFALSAT